MFGTVCGLLAVEFGGWIVAAGLVGLVAVLVFPNLVRLRNKHPDPGIDRRGRVADVRRGGVSGSRPDGHRDCRGWRRSRSLEFKLELHRFAEKLRDGD